MKSWMMNVLRGFGIVFLVASALIVIGEMSQMVHDIGARQPHQLDCEPWLIAFAVASFGGLLWQTGKVTETLTVMTKSFPAMLDLVKSRLPGGSRKTDPPVVSPAPPV